MSFIAQHVWSNWKLGEGGEAEGWVRPAGGRPSLAPHTLPSTLAQLWEAQTLNISRQGLSTRRSSLVRSLYSFKGNHST